MKVIFDVQLTYTSPCVAKTAKAEMECELPAVPFVGLKVQLSRDTDFMTVKTVYWSRLKPDQFECSLDFEDDSGVEWLEKLTWWKEQGFRIVSKDYFSKD